MSRDDAYSPLKIVRHLDVVQGIRSGKPMRPAHVQLILSDLCNQACGFCAYRDPTYSSSQMFYEIKEKGAALRKDEAHPERNYNPNRMIPTVKAKEILYDCRSMGVSGIQFTGGGEPTVHPDFVDVLTYAQQNWDAEEGDTSRMATSLVTNGVMVGKKRGDAAWQKALGRLSWVRVSVDAGHADTYCETRNVPYEHWTAVRDGIRSLVDLRDSRTPKLVVGVGFVVTEKNWREIYEAAALAKTLGADNIRISAQFSADGAERFRDFWAAAKALAAAAQHDFQGTHFRVYDRFGEKLGDLEQGRPDYQRCGYQEVTTYIGGDLNVYRCCVQSYNEHGLIGSLKDRRFKDLWMAQERAGEMRAFDARSCERCQFNNINRNLDYILRSEDPDHSEFV